MSMTVDRIEGDFAVCELENGEIKNIPLENLPFGIKEGNVISENENGFFINVFEEQERIKRIEEKMKKLFNK